MTVTDSEYICIYIQQYNTNYFQKVNYLLSSFFFLLRVFRKDGSLLLDILFLFLLAICIHASTNDCGLKFIHFLNITSFEIPLNSSTLTSRVSDVQIVNELALL